MRTEENRDERRLEARLGLISLPVDSRESDGYPAFFHPVTNQMVDMVGASTQLTLLNPLY